MPVIFVCCVFFFVLPAAAFQIPGAMDESEQIETLKILGLGTSTKTISYGYPLGGYPGIEVGLNYETINTDGIESYSDGTGEKGDLTYTKLSLAKGLYSNLDVFVQFIPLNEPDGLSDWGGFLKWGFYEGRFLPIVFSAIIHGNATNIKNKISSESIGWDLTASLYVDDLTLTVGTGYLNSNGKFIGGSNGVTASQDTESHTVDSIHSLVSASYAISDLFVAFQIDRYTRPVYSFKLGLRL